METGSDYFTFVSAGIPTGGTRAGAGDIKTEQVRDIAGGVAYVAYDPCYHLFCDTLSNINLAGLADFSRATANTLQTLAQDPAIINSFHKVQQNNRRNTEELFKILEEFEVE